MWPRSHGCRPSVSLQRAPSVTLPHSEPDSALLLAHFTEEKTEPRGRYRSSGRRDSQPAS